MIIVKPKFEILAIMGYDPEHELSSCDTPLALIEKAGRTCYKSEDKITPTSSIKFINALIASGHESVIEHSAMTVKFTVDRGITHELVRHRLAAFSQESTRYCNYSKEDEIEVIEPFFFDPNEELRQIDIPVAYDMNYSNTTLEIVGKETYMLNSFDVWCISCLTSEWAYMTLINEFGRSAQQARSVLPISLKAEIVVTANFREWRHILKLRCAKSAHPQMQEIMIPLKEELKKLIPVIFNDI